MPDAPAAPAPPDSKGPAKLHDHALQAEKHLEALATGLAAAGVDEAAVKGIARMADAVRGLVKQLNQQSADAPPPEPPAAKPTMDSATNELAADLTANR